jgi:hypothetical protein
LALLVSLAVGGTIGFRAAWEHGLGSALLGLLAGLALGFLALWALVVSLAGAFFLSERGKRQRTSQPDEGTQMP